LLTRVNNHSQPGIPFAFPATSKEYTQSFSVAAFYFACSFSKRAGGPQQGPGPASVDRRKRLANSMAELEPLEVPVGAKVLKSKGVKRG
jgi:hypothetical protein